MIRFIALLSIAAAAVFVSSCDKHTWKETQVLHESYGPHAGHGAAAEHEGGAKGEHGAKAEGHAEEAKK